MKARLLKILGVEPGEESMVSMLLTQSVFLGIFFGAFDISAHSLFLSIFDEKMMARGYVVSGLAGIILTSTYTWLQTKIAFKNFAVSNLVFVSVMTLVLWLLLMFSRTNWVIFIVFIMLGPLNILAMLGFWGTTARLFTLRQGKRLFSLVDVGLIVGIIVSCYAIPVLLAFSFKAHNILLISAASALIASILQILIGSRFRFSSAKAETDDQEGKEKKSLLSVLRNDRYIRIMGTFIALSVMTAFFVQYSFMAVTREQYPAEEDMARFLGLFTGSMMIFTLLIKLLVFSYLIRNYGLKICLALSPVLVALFTLIAVLLGTFMGYKQPASGFMLFFMLLALSRLFSKSLKDSIESPSFKVLYQTLDESIRYEIQSGMDGTVNEISALTSGLLLAGLGILSFVKLIHFSWVLFAITVIWVFVALMLYSEYRKSIRNALDSGGHVDQPDEITNGSSPVSRFSAGTEFKNDYFGLVSGNISSLEKKSSHYYHNLISYSSSNRDINLLPALKKISGDNFADTEIRKLSAQVAESLSLLNASDSDKEDKLLSARKILAGPRQPQTTFILRLLRDNSAEARKLAINMIGKFRLTDMLPEVCECLNVDGLGENAEGVLTSFGQDAAAELQRYYLAASGNTNTCKTILKILAGSPSKGNEAFIFSRLWSNSRQVKETALRYLVQNNFKAPDEDRDRLHQYISDVIGIITWDIAARITISKGNDDLLLEAINGEISRWNMFLFNLLAITYESGSIERIRENLNRETVESVNYALEMIDIVVDDSIKPKLVPLLDVIPDEEKMKSLFHFFPGEIPDHQNLIENIINRDYNLLGVWIRACIIRNTRKIENPHISESLTALLFSPEEILREESALLLSKSDPETFRSAAGRLPVTTKNRLDRIISGKILPGELLWQKVRFLSEILPSVKEDYLLFLACRLRFISEAKPSSVLIDDENITWQTGTFSYILALEAVEEFIRQYPDQSPGMIKFIELNEN